MADYGSGYRDGKRLAALDLHLVLQGKEREIARLLDALSQEKAETARLREALEVIMVYSDCHESARDIARAALGYNELEDRWDNE